MSLKNLGALAPISLAELTQSSALMSRVDRKYFVPRAIVEELIAENMANARVLEIDGRRSFTYETEYFDSPDFGFYRAHAQGKRNRFKVRVRTYRDSGLRMLEVKSKGFRGRTVKERIKLPVHVAETTADSLSFGETERLFVDQIIGSDSSDLQPVLRTVYRRSTLALGNQRVTLDTALECIGGQEIFHGPDDVLVETKSPARASAFDAALKARNIRPHAVSKYCVAASLIYPQLPRNRWNRTLKRFFQAPARVSQLSA